MRIAVLVKQVPDTWEPPQLDVATGLLDRSASPSVADEIGERAVEAALVLRDADGEVIAITMGPDDATATLRKALAMGADSAVHIVDDALAGSDLRATAEVLAAVLAPRGFDLIIAGIESSDGRGAMVPVLLAELMQLPLLAGLDSLAVHGAEVSGDRRGPGRVETLKVGLPAVVSITERLPDPRFPGIKGTITAKRKPLTTIALAELGLRLGDLPRSVIVSAQARPARGRGIRLEAGPDAGQRLASLLRERGLTGVPAASGAETR